MYLKAVQECQTLLSTVLVSEVPFARFCVVTVYVYVSYVNTHMWAMYVPCYTMCSPPIGGRHWEREGVEAVQDLLQFHVLAQVTHSRRPECGELLQCGGESVMSYCAACQSIWAFHVVGNGVTRRQAHWPWTRFSLIGDALSFTQLLPLHQIMPLSPSLMKAIQLCQFQFRCLPACPFAMLVVPVVQCINESCDICVTISLRESHVTVM